LQAEFTNKLARSVKVLDGNEVAGDLDRICNIANLSPFLLVWAATRKKFETAPDERNQRG
jgi:hypothetical protein